MDQSLPLIYSLVRRTREAVFSYTESLPLEVYTKEHPQFGFGSIRNLQAHIADCYLWWVQEVGMGAKPDYLKAEEIKNTEVMRKYFAKVDRVLEKAFAEFKKLDEVHVWKHQDHPPVKISQRWLIMHPITHEFNHKGQMLSLGRVLGRPFPPGKDADLATPFEAPGA